MITQDFILLIMNCKKYEKKALVQKTTWLKTVPSYLKYYHVIGDESLDNDFIFDDVNQVLWVKTPDDYNSLPKKVIQSYIAVNSTFDYKYIFKTDDDQMLVNSNFFNTITKLITNKKPTSHYGGYVVDVPFSYLSQYHIIHPELPKYLPVYATKYCNGRFYFLSKHAVEDLITKKANIMNEYLEDYAIGFNLDERYKIDILNIAINKIFTDISLSDYQDKEMFIS
jgi:hypothetical protein